MGNTDEEKGKNRRHTHCRNSTDLREKTQKTITLSLRLSVIPLNDDKAMMNRERKRRGRK